MGLRRIGIKLCTSVDKGGRTFREECVLRRKTRRMKRKKKKRRIRKKKRRSIPKNIIERNSQTYEIVKWDQRGRCDKFFNRN
jgi:5'-3' exonuclease